MFTDFLSDRNDRLLLRFWNYTGDEHDGLLRRFFHLAANEAAETRIPLSATAFGIGTLVLRTTPQDRGAKVQASTNSIVWELG